MILIEELELGKPVDHEDDYVKGYADGVEASINHIKTKHSKLILTMLEDKHKLANALTGGGYCPGDFVESEPSVAHNCIPNSDKCLQCWSDRL
jgi:hypothetical protein